MYSPSYVRYIELIWSLSQCRDDIPNHTTNAEITYTFVGLTDKGNTINEKALQLIYAHDLKDWEKAINHYLMTGEKLSHHWQIHSRFIFNNRLNPFEFKIDCVRLNK